MKKILTTMFTFMAVVAFASDSFAKELSPEDVKGAMTVTAEEVITMIEDMDDLVVIDARKEKDYTAGHIEGSVNLANTNTTPETLAKILESKSTPAIFYCNGIYCMRSSDAAQKQLMLVI